VQGGAYGNGAIPGCSAGRRRGRRTSVYRSGWSHSGGGCRSTLILGLQAELLPVQFCQRHQGREVPAEESPGRGEARTQTQGVKAQESHPHERPGPPPDRSDRPPHQGSVACSARPNSDLSSSPAPVDPEAPDQRPWAVPEKKLPRSTLSGGEQVTTGLGSSSRSPHFLHLGEPAQLIPEGWRCGCQTGWSCGSSIPPASGGEASLAVAAD
jgi:hypothetical protein